MLRKLSAFAETANVRTAHTGPANCSSILHGLRDGAYLHSVVQEARAMCGIAGLFSKSLEVSDNLGSHLGDMLLQLSDRGPDSAGVAVYRDPAPSGSSKVSLFSPDPQQDWGAVRTALDEAFGAGEPEPRGSHAVIVVETDAAVAQSWLRERYPELRVMSAGQAIEI